MSYSERGVAHEPELVTDGGTAMIDARTSSKRAGERAEASVIEAVDELEAVDDIEDEHIDARTSTLLEPSSELPFGGICLLEAGSAIEIKSAMAVYGESQSTGRFYLRRGQHEHLLELAASYLFAVCRPVPKRELIAMKIVPASLVDELVSSWIDAGAGRPQYAQLSWSRIFTDEEVNR